VTSGVGKGAYYVTRPQYLNFFKKVLKAHPFPGTLNVIIDGKKTSEILPHTYTPMEYGTIRYATGKIGEIPIVVIRPQKSVHPENVIEIVAPINLRKKLKLTDGSEIEFQIFL